jgi:hypothetical protein
MHGYRPRSNRVKNENRDVLGDSYNILHRKTNSYFQLLNVFGVNEICQSEIHTAKSLVHKVEINTGVLISP